MRATAIVLLSLLFIPGVTAAQFAPSPASLRASVQLRDRVPATATAAAVPDGIEASRRFSSRAPGATMMIIGGAAIITGILVAGNGGTVLIIGGVVLGAYGFYLYER